MARSPKTNPGDRIRVVDCGGAPELNAAEGTVVEVHDHALTVDWDTERLNRLEVMLVKGVDRWEVIERGAPPDA